MCGIAGIADSRGRGISVEALASMASAIRHRGPDGYGFFTTVRDSVGLAHVRLSIVDIAGGAQPLTNEDGQVVITYNGEVYNHLELRRELESKGHVFRTRSDTEVLVHAYEEWGAEMLHRLNGQFAFCIYDAVNRSLFMARDRFGVRPFFHTQRDGRFYFASEIKALLATGDIEAAVDPAALDEVFTMWAAHPPRTGFRDIFALEPGTYAIWRAGHLRSHRYYELTFDEQREEPRDAVERLDELLHTAVSMRMRADVPVGAYVSGGLDSSITSSLAASMSPYDLRSFSIAFSDPRFDESEFQQRVAAAVGSKHAVAFMDSGTIADSFPQVVWHAETPLLRTAPAPMFHLAALTKAAGIKVVLTGEGADELFLGYDLFKEVSVRRFCLRQPASASRRRLFDRLYPYLGGHGKGEFWARFFLNAGSADDALFSHMPRFLLTSWIKEFYSADFSAAVARTDVLGDLRRSLPRSFVEWSPLNRAAFLEMKLLLSPYLLSSQSDRMAMAHGVEGRFPFLDHRLFEFAAALPTASRLLGLKEKQILRRWAKRRLPSSIPDRGKQPYRAPDAASFFGPAAPEFVSDMLAPDALRATGLWASSAVAALVNRCRAGKTASQRENQALVGILSTQLWHHQFVQNKVQPPPLHPADADVFIRDDVAVLA
jgi:asparagine synthase (glutamine-hydrolysing)